MYKNGDKCQICGVGRLTKKSIEEKFEYKGEVLIIPDYIIYECPVCEEAIVDESVSKATEKEIRDFHRKVDKLLTSDQIREIRNLCGFTQERFGEILGGGKKAFARYENGTVTQSRAMDNLLRLLRRHPESLSSEASCFPLVNHGADKYRMPSYAGI